MTAQLIRVSRYHVTSIGIGFAKIFLIPCVWLLYITYVKIGYKTPLRVKHYYRLRLKLTQLFYPVDQISQVMAYRQTNILYKSLVIPHLKYCILRCGIHIH